MNFESGNLVETIPILSFHGAGPGVDLALTYNSLDDNAASSLGPGWTHSYATRIATDTGGYLVLAEGDGRRIVFVESPAGSGSYVPELRFHRPGVSIRKIADGTYELTRRNHTTIDFDAQGRMTKETDRNGNEVTLTWVGQFLTRVTDATGRAVLLGYNSANLLETITDPMNHVTRLEYESGRLKSITDAEQKTTGFIYQGGRLWTKTDPEGWQVEYGYDSNTGRLQSATDNSTLSNIVGYPAGLNTATVMRRNGQTTTTTFDPVFDVPLQTVAPDNGVTIRTYDGNGNMSSITDPEHNFTQLGHNDFGDLTWVANAVGDNTVYTHNVYGQVETVETITDPQEDLTRYVYDSQGNLERMIAADNAVTRFEYVPGGRGLLDNVIGPDNQVTHFTYDPHGYVETVTNPVRLTTRFVHDNVGNLISRQDPNLATTTFVYDNVNRLIQVIDDQQHVTEYAYYGNGPLKSVEDGNHHKTSFTYNQRKKPETITDALGKVSRYTYTYGCSSCGPPGGDFLETATDNNGHVTRYEPDEMGRLKTLTDPTWHSTSYTYFKTGDQKSRTDANRHERRYLYDPANRLSTVFSPLTRTALLAYTPRGLLDNVTDADGNVTRYVYDPVGKLEHTYSQDTNWTSYGYYPNGTLYARADNGVTTATYSYDNAARLTEVSFLDNTRNITFGYDSPGSSYGKGRLTNMTDPSGTTVYQYNSLGRLIQEQKTALGHSHEISYGSDNVGNLTSITYPSGRVVEYVYDERNRPTRVTSTKGGVAKTIASEIIYDPVGNLKSVPMGNGLSQLYGHDNADRVTTIYVPGVLGLSFGYDNVGNVASVSDNVNLLSSPAYDPATANTTYDYRGNRLDNVVQGSTARTFAYTVGGSIRHDGTRQFVYDDDHRLIQVVDGGTVKGEYVYDGKGRRTIKTASGTTTVFHFDRESRLIGETNASGELIAEYIYLEGKPLAMVRKSGATEEYYYLHVDHLGTPKAMTNQNRAVVWRVDFDPFGNEIGNPIKLVENNLRFPGQYFDAETGLHYNLFRDYDPKTGRYIEPDPIGLAGGMNLYPYVENRPTVRIDLGGLSSLLYDSSSNKIWVFDRQMRVVGFGPASNNAQRASKGPWPAGTFPYEGYVPHPEDDSNGRFGPYGNYLFTVPSREFMGVHAGRNDSCDRANRCGYEYATDGCIRTTDEIMNLIRQLHTRGDSLEWLSVIYRD